MGDAGEAALAPLRLPAGSALNLDFCRQLAGALEAASRRPPVQLRAVLPMPACRQLLQRADALLKAEPTLVHVSCPPLFRDSKAAAVSEQLLAPAHCALAWQARPSRRTTRPPDRCISPSSLLLPPGCRRCTHPLAPRWWLWETSTDSTTTC